jgi:hypothetical protein
MLMRRALSGAVIGAFLWLGLRAAPPVPDLISIFPFGGQPGAQFTVTMRGRALDRVTGIWFDCDQLSATVSALAPESPGAAQASTKAPAAAKKRPSSGGPLQLLSLEVRVAPHAAAGVHYLRVLTPGGLSNPLPIRIHAEPSVMEAAVPHELPAGSQPLAIYPAVVNGKLAGKGEVDYYSFEVEKGEKLRFEAVTAGAGFDPSLTLYEPTGSWFRSDRLTELAFNDEPVSYPGLPLHAALSYEFPKKGRYLIRIGGFLGEGGADHAYQLSIRRAEPEQPDTDPMRSAHLPSLAADALWKERTWKRELTPDRLKTLWSRAVSPASVPAIPVLKIDDDPHGASSEPVPVTLPVMIEGAVENPGDIDRVKFRVKEGDRVSLEVQTAQKTIPLFNPYLRIVSTDGDEAFTNVHSRVNTCGDTIIKQVEPKTTYSFPREGEFVLEIRDITHAYGDKTFAYRVLLRQQIPHVGEVHVAEDQVNLTAGEVRKLSIGTDQEEGYDGYVALSLEGLPEGVRAVMGTELEPAVPAPFNPGKIERFRPESQKATFLLLSEPSAPATRTPVEVRVMAQPSVKGKLGRPILVKKVLVTVVQPGTSVSDERPPQITEAR